MRWRSVAACGIGILLSFASAAVAGEDWNRWRGPLGTGVAPVSPPLADTWPASGPVQVWKSETIPAGNDGGFGSLSIAGNRGYLFVNWKVHQPIAWRKLTDPVLRQLGWTPEKMPPDLAKAVEEARVSKERADLKRNEIRAWVDKWVAEHVDEAQRPKPPGRIAAERLSKGAAAFSLEVLDKLASVKDKEFATQEALEKWLDENAIPADVKAAVLKAVPKTQPVSQDVILCLDLSNGSTVWKKEYPGVATEYGSSSTPFVVDGRVYVAGAKTVYCLKADDGNEVWRAPMKANEISSSPVVAEGVVAILAGSLTGLDGRDGNVLWTQPKLKGSAPSPVTWKKGDKTYLICNSGGGAGCVDPATGNLLWTAPGAGSGTAAVSEDAMVIFAENKNVGLVAYRISPEKAEKLWSRPITDRGTTPIISGGNVYAVGGGKALCIRLEDGNAVTEQAHPGEINSPLLADGKLFAIGQSGQVVQMYRADGTAFSPLAKFKLKTAQCASPSFAAGRLYLRLADGVACYELKK